jgi:hypothetical protein
MLLPTASSSRKAGHVKPRAYIPIGCHGLYRAIVVSAACDEDVRLA